MTSEQEQLKAKHGTPEEFARSAMRQAANGAIPFSEATEAIAKYNDEWKRVGGQTCCWEVVAPAYVCGKTADWQTNGKWFCPAHKEALLTAGKRFAEIVVNKDKINDASVGVDRDSIIEECAKVLETQVPGTRYSWMQGSAFGDMTREMAGRIRSLKQNNPAQGR